MSTSCGLVESRANRSGELGQLRADAGLRPRSPVCRPRIHDLRHRFAVQTLLDWYRDGVDVQPRLPLLSTYLGHYVGDRRSPSPFGLT
jgi:integrase/recombinase XerD